MSIIKKLLRILLFLIGPIIVLLIAASIYLKGGRFISTDNAYLKADILSVSSELSGKVLHTYVEENQRVNAGDTTAEIFPEPYQIAIARAEANLASVKGDLLSQKADYANRELDIVVAKTDFDFRQHELDRLARLRADNSVSEAQFDQAKFVLEEAKNRLSAKRLDLDVSRAKLINPEAPVEEHPRYLQAMAELTKAKLDFSYTRITAPLSGIATNVSVHPGENIISGTTLFNIVDDSHFWIEANFKETELTHVRSGQAVTISIDTYPEAAWTGSVERITPATGAEFSLLPAQNSSGNWIKVVQRIRVRITLDTNHETLPLAAGMSATVNIDTGNTQSIAWLPSWLNGLLRDL